MIFSTVDHSFRIVMTETIFDRNCVLVGSIGRLVFDV